MQLNNFCVINNNSHNITVVINNSRFVNSYLNSYTRKIIAENMNLLLFLDGNIILSLPSFADSGCHVALPGFAKSGVAGTVMDSDSSTRLMVCFYDGCWLRGEDWIKDDSLQLRYNFYGAFQILSAICLSLMLAIRLYSSHLCLATIFGVNVLFQTFSSSIWVWFGRMACIRWI